MGKEIHGVICCKRGCIKKRFAENWPEKGYQRPMDFYKVILVNNKTDKKMIAFLFPHKKSDAALAMFAVPADSIEKITGIDFFPALPNKLEKELERKEVLDGWDGVQ